MVVHCRTVKGKGFAPAEEGGLEGMEKWHAAKPASIVNGAAGGQAQAGQGPRTRRPPQYTKVFGDALVAEAQRDERVIGITAAMNSGTGLDILQRELPDRYYDVGIAEQHAVLFAAGLALQGAKPVAAIYSTFLQRAFDQIVHDVCLQELDVVFAMDRAGPRGRRRPHSPRRLRHLLSALRFRTWCSMAPRDEALLVHMLRTALVPRGAGGAALSARRGGGRAAAGSRRRRSRSVAESCCVRVSGSPSSATAMACRVALGAADRLVEDHGVEATVADARFAKPLDES